MHINKHRRARKDLKIHANMRIGLKGFFTVTLIEAATGRIKQYLEFENLITDAGLNAMNNTSIETLIDSFMGVGTNATAPANGDVALGAEIAPTTTHRSNSTGGIAEVFGAGAANAYWFRKITRNFIETQANGNLTELGLFTANTGGTMWCRQLFKDGTGTPTVVVKTAADQLRVTYEIRLYNPADVTVNPIAISGTNYSVTTRATKIDDNRRWGHDGSTFSVMFGFKGDNPNTGNVSFSAVDGNTLPASTANPVVTSTTTPTSTAKAAYVNGNFFLDYTVIWDPGIANPAGGIGGVLVSAVLAGSSSGATNCQFMMAFTPKLPKDNTKRLTLVLRLSWGRGP